MTAALGLAARGLGRVWPNPTVGCVVVRDGRVVGRGWTQPGGRPHAESEALRRAGDGARGATAYVTLEPCAHQGETPPCAEALVAAGIRRAVAAIEDPDPRVSGRGIETLRTAGIEAECGALADAAARLNAGYLWRLTRGRPLVTLKVATTLDGRTATGKGESRWITGEQARARAHRLRAEHDAVMIGAGTAQADDPALTCRLPGLADASPVRIIADGSLADADHGQPGAHGVDGADVDRHIERSGWRTARGAGRSWCRGAGRGRRWGRQAGHEGGFTGAGGARPHPRVGRRRRRVDRGPLARRSRGPHRLVSMRPK